ncbi:MAG: hypothetical protein IJ373_06980 [Clostridia bacterium]|nr:hypothetical protein [Clostridia bacterium]
MSFYRTKAAFAKILNDFKKIRNSITVGVHVLSIAYLIYAIAMQTGFWAVNIALLALTSIYFIFFVIMELRAATKKLKRRIKRFYTWCKRLIKLPVLGIAVYGLALSKTAFDPMSFLMTLLMIVGWILDILLYFIIRFVEIEKEYLLDSLHADTQEIPFIGGWISNALPESDRAEENFKRLEPFIAKIKAKDELKKLEKKHTLKQLKGNKTAEKEEQTIPKSKILRARGRNRRNG